MSLATLYVTTPSLDEAKVVARHLLEKRLAACANIIPGISSLYWWEGKIQEEDEIIVIMKTRMELVRQAVEAVKEVHSYDVPCVTAMPILKASPEYARWVEEETEQPETRLA